MAKVITWLVYAWFSVGQLVLAEVITDAYFTVNSSSSLCDAKSFLASIKKTKKQYKIFDSGNLDIHQLGITWFKAENICKNKKFCPSCILPEPKNEDEKYVLRKLANNCSVERPFLGGKVLNNYYQWRSDGTTVKLGEPPCDIRLSSSWAEGCLKMNDRSEFCKIDCDPPFPVEKSFICEIKRAPTTPTQEPTTIQKTKTQPTFQTQAPEPDSESKEDTPSLSIATIVGIVVGSVVGLVVLVGLVYLCVNKNRSEQRTGIPSPNTHQSQPLAGSGLQTQQYPGSFSQPPVSAPVYTQGQPGLAYGPPEPAYTFGPPGSAYAPEPAYTFGPPGPAYAQTPPSPSFSASVNTLATPGTTYIAMEPSPYYTQVPSSPYYSHEPSQPPVVVYAAPYYQKRTTCTVS